jgi:probable HAF family extracellular repeat protein
MGTIVLAAACLTGRVSGQTTDDTDANGVSMKLYPIGYREAIEAQTNKVKKTASSGGVLSSATSLASPNGLDAASPNGNPLPIPQYTVIDLGTLSGGYSQAMGINSAGQVVGYSSASGGLSDAFLWQNGSMQDLGSLGGDYPYAYAYGINSAGQVTGYTSTSGGAGHAFLWQNGSMQDLGTLGGWSYGYGINSAGQVTGYSGTSVHTFRAFLWQNGFMQDLGTLGGQNSYGYGINDAGQVVGSAYTNTGGSVLHAFLWQNGSMQDLGTLGGGSSEAYGVNSAGQVVGYANTSTGAQFAFLWQNGSMQNLGSLGGYSSATGINSAGQVVGASATSTGAQDAFLWQNGTMYDLKNLLFNQNSGWVLQAAQGINDAGQIAGYGYNPSGQIHAFLLNPLPVGSVSAASTVQTALPTYGTCPAPQPSQNSLVFITHGWVDKLYESIQLPEATNFVNWTSNAVAQYLASQGLNNWNVQGFMWTAQADQYAPMLALLNAEQQGKSIGDSIVAGGYTDIHFIAHSAGAGLIQKAAEEIRATSQVPVTIHCTFLDAYDGVIGEKAYEYGTKADWADSYFVRDAVQEAGWTGRLLPNAYNVDVTALDSTATSHQVTEGLFSWCNTLESNHGWPNEFYSNSVAIAIASINAQSIFEGSYYAGFGFSLSDEVDGLQAVKSRYPPGNGLSYGTVTALGINSGCIPPYVAPPLYFGTIPGFLKASTIQSTTGTLSSSLGAAGVGTGSPVWLATVITDTNALNYVSFDAKFTSAAGADGLLTVYWDTNMIGEIDEAAVLPGLQHYNLSFPNTAPNTSHVLGFHVDPFTGVHSTLVLTNIVTGCVGVSQPPVLSVTANTGSGLTYKLTGQPGTYTVQSSADLLNWTEMGVLLNTNGSVQFADPNSTNYPSQFYRAVTPTSTTQ